MANDTTGGAGVAKADSMARVANLPICLRLVSPPTSPTAQKTHGMDRGARGAMLEILQQSLQNYIEAGGKVTIHELPHREDRPERVAIILYGVKVSNG